MIPRSAPAPNQPQIVNQEGAGSPRVILRKHVGEIAIEPLPGSKALNVTTRKVLNVMRHIAQAQFNERGVYTAPLSALLRGAGSGITNGQRLMRYLGDAQMLVMRATLFTGDQTMELFDDDAPEKDKRRHSSIRQFQVLGQVDMDFVRGQWIVTWYYAPAVNEMLLPDRYARIDLGYMSGLDRYASVVLYEICCRFRDSPGGLTSRGSLAFWMGIMREQTIKAMEWRRFKYTLLNPAIDEVNRITDLEVELIEYKRGKTIFEAQFRVRAKKVAKLSSPEPAADLTLIVTCEALGLDERKLDALTTKYGEAAVQRVVDRVYEKKLRTATFNVTDMYKYLTAALENEPTGDLFDKPAIDKPVGDHGPTKLAMHEAKKSALLADQYAQNLTHLHEIENLPETIRQELSDAVFADPMGKKFNPNADNWANPLFRAMLISAYKKRLPAEPATPEATDGVEKLLGRGA